MKADMTDAHRWLQRLIGDWTYEIDPADGHGESPQKIGGTEHVRALGDVWIVGEGKGRMPDGSPSDWQLTLGYDPGQQRFVGTWIGSMMNFLWIYRDGFLDADGRVLTLEAEGPTFDGTPGTALYRDIVTLQADDVRVLTGNVLGANGQWNQFCRTTYRRQR
jgi:hypothetical protein